jgi:glycine cleavage system aminomethyltransferase T
LEASLAIGSRIRRSPFYTATVAAGATDFTVYNHMYLPTSFGEPIEEYRRLIEGVAVWDVAAERQVEIAGPAAAFTQYLSA